MPEVYAKDATARWAVRDLLINVSTRIGPLMREACVHIAILNGTIETGEVEIFINSSI